MQIKQQENYQENGEEYYNKIIETFGHDIVNENDRRNRQKKTCKYYIF